MKLYGSKLFWALPCYAITVTCVTDSGIRRAFTVSLTCHAKLNFPSVFFRAIAALSARSSEKTTGATESAAAALLARCKEDDNCVRCDINDRRRTNASEENMHRAVGKASQQLRVD